MKQFDAEAYLALVRTWSKKHNIIGGLDPCELFSQAREALKNTPEIVDGSLVVDVGAGAGWMAMAWLSMSTTGKAYCIEPDPKSSSFLFLALSSLEGLNGRLFVDDRRFEGVPRETIARIDPNFTLVSRAFSPADALLPLYEASDFRSDSLYLFFYNKLLPKGQRSRLKPI
ncbi:hypothetical protein GW915_02135 [bacterium]|nr:hypothetical protein [bacterium]